MCERIEETSVSPFMFACSTRSSPQIPRKAAGLALEELRPYRMATVRSTAYVSLETGNIDEMFHGFFNNPRTLAEWGACFDYLPT